MPTEATLTPNSGSTSSVYKAPQRAQSPFAGNLKSAKRSPEKPSHPETSTGSSEEKFTHPEIEIFKRLVEAGSMTPEKCEQRTKEVLRQKKLIPSAPKPGTGENVATLAALYESDKRLTTCITRIKALKKALVDSKKMTLKTFVIHAMNTFNEVLGTPPQSELAHHKSVRYQLLLDNKIITEEKFNKLCLQIDSSESKNTTPVDQNLTGAEHSESDAQRSEKVDQSSVPPKTDKPAVPPKSSLKKRYVPTGSQHQTPVVQSSTGQRAGHVAGMAARFGRASATQKPVSTTPPPTDAAPKQATPFRNQTPSAKYSYEDDLSSFGPREQEEDQSLSPEEIQEIKDDLAKNNVVAAAVQATKNAEAANKIAATHKKNAETADKIAQKAAERAANDPSEKNIAAASSAKRDANAANEKANKSAANAKFFDVEADTAKKKAEEKIAEDAEKAKAAKAAKDEPETTAEKEDRLGRLAKSRNEVTGALNNMFGNRLVSTPQAQAEPTDETRGAEAAVTKAPPPASTLPPLTPPQALHTPNATLQEALQNRAKIFRPEEEPAAEDAEAAVTPPPTEITTARKNSLPKDTELQAGATIRRSEEPAAEDAEAAVTKEPAAPVTPPPPPPPPPAPPALQNALPKGIQGIQEELRAKILGRTAATPVETEEPATPVESKAQPMSIKSPSLLSLVLSFIATPFTMVFNLFSRFRSTNKTATTAAAVVPSNAASTQKPQLKPKPKPKPKPQNPADGIAVSQEILQKATTYLRRIPDQQAPKETKQPSELEKKLEKQRNKIKVDEEQ